MRAPEGGFFAALDADSEGHEGRFYVWQRDEVESLLAPDEYRVLARRYGLDREPNFEGAWHLHAFVTLERVAEELAITVEEAQALLDSARGKLLAERAKRIRPGLDDKILTAWNALMIRGLAIAGRMLETPALVDAALRAVDFLRANAWRDGRLYASWKGGAARFPAYLDDHAFLLDALIEALQSRFRVEDLHFAGEVADALLSKFADRERGGFWFTAAGEDPPLYRPKNFADDAMPSGNGIGAQALARLGWLTGESRYLEAAEAAIRGAYASLARAPEAHAAMLNALDEYLEPVGDRDRPRRGGGSAGLAGGARARVRAAAPGARDSVGCGGPAGGACDASARGSARSPTSAAGRSARSRSSRSRRFRSTPHGLELREPRIVGRIARQPVADFAPRGALVVEDVALRLAVDRARDGRAHDVHLARAEGRGEEERRAAGRAEAAPALLRGRVPARLGRSRQEAEALFGRADPAHESRAMRLAAVTAVAVRKEECRRRDRKSHRAAEAASLEFRHGPARRPTRLASA